MKPDPQAPGLHSRRNALRILAVGGAAGVAWKWGLFDRKGRGPVTRSRVLMGTVVHMNVLGLERDEAEAAADAALERMASLEAILSRHRQDSELSRLVASGALDDASPALIDVLALSERISELGDGAFDITIQPVLDVYGERPGARRELPPPEAVEAAVERVDHRAVRVSGRSVTLARPGMKLTLDGVGKGYVVDRGVEALREHGLENVFVEAGGDLMAGGRRDVGTPWRIGIRNPRPGTQLVARCEAENRAVATSGDYMQPFTADYKLHHILDPRTGFSSPELASATVIAPDAATADALATLTMVTGSRRGRELLEELPGCEGYFVSKSLDVVRTSGFPIA